MHCFISGTDCIGLGESVTDIFSPRSFVVPFFTQLCTFDAESFNFMIQLWSDGETNIFVSLFVYIRERNFADTTIFTTSFYGCLFDRIKKNTKCKMISLSRIKFLFICANWRISIKSISIKSLQVSSTRKTKVENLSRVILFKKLLVRSTMIK